MRPKVKVWHLVECPHCGGNGTVSSLVTCDTCEGDGEIECEITDTEAIDFLLAQQTAPEPPEFDDKARVIHRQGDAWRVCKVDGSGGRLFATLYEADQHILDVHTGRFSQ